MLKHLKFAAIALLLTIGFTACSDDEPTPTPYHPRGEKGFYVVNQGNSYSKIAGSIDEIAFGTTDTTLVSSVFQKANGGMSIGNSPQEPIIYGSKIYIPMYDENLVWVIDAKSMKHIVALKTNQPEAVCGCNGYLFVTNNDGYVTRFDTINYTHLDPLAVGPNPSGITASNNKVYVAISDGYNSSANYENGFKVAQIDAKEFTIDKNITVGMNPTNITSDNQGNIFVACQGNYGYNSYPYQAPKIWKIDNAGNAAEFCDGSIIATDNQNRLSRSTEKQSVLYVLNATTDWSIGATNIASSIYNTQTGELLQNDFLPSDNLPGNPICIDINPTTNELYICADSNAFGYGDPGYVFVYSASGDFITKYNVGVHPYGVIFK